MTTAIRAAWHRRADGIVELRQPLRDGGAVIAYVRRVEHYHREHEWSRTIHGPWTIASSYYSAQRAVRRALREEPTP